MNNSTKYFLILVCILLSACSGIKLLPPGEKLYTGAKIKLESTDKKIKNEGYIRTIAEDAVRPKPNQSILGMRPRLIMYLSAGDAPKSRFKKWLKKTGEAPVLMSSVKPGVTSSIIDAKLFNIGIFKSHTVSSIIEKKHTSRLIYTSYIHKPFAIKDIVYSISDDSLSHTILTDKEKSFIKPGVDYNLELIKSERTRIDALLKNKGYFYFNPDYLLYKADTSAVEKTITLRLTLKDNLPENALNVYHINNVYINQDYSLRRDTGSLKDTMMYENNVFFGREADQKIRPRVILRSVYLKKQDIYSRQNHIITLNRLMSMGNFKFVQVKFAESDSTNSNGLLDVSILMTPMPKHTFSAELDIVNKTNPDPIASRSYTGPRMNFSILNRNTFKGAELFKVNMAGSFEAQLGGENKNSYSYSWGPELELTFPRFIVPFPLKVTNSIYVPKTRFALSYNYLKKVDYFDMRTFQFIYGFKWKETIRKEHELNPINISYTSLVNRTDSFNNLLVHNPFLKKSYEEQFIAGGNYSFTYNEQVIPGKKVQYYLRLTAESAGSMFSLANSIFGKKISSTDPSRIVGSVYSQFGKLSVDGRAYYNFRDKNKLAMRIFAGAANSFGNSSVLPYSKQFFSGGPNSIRAFQINSIGPGNFNQREDTTIGFLQLGGDIKLEMNAEYRFNIYKFFKGAFFIDAGNIWLQKSNPTNTGSPFLFSSFLDEMAVGAGFGLRIDVSFFILRFDLATPLRKPWLDKGQRWVTDQIKLGSSSWRGDNLILNVAIGYPF